MTRPSSLSLLLAPAFKFFPNASSQQISLIISAHSNTCRPFAFPSHWSSMKGMGTELGQPGMFQQCVGPSLTEVGGHWGWDEGSVATPASTPAAALSSRGGWARSYLSMVLSPLHGLLSFPWPFLSTVFLHRLELLLLLKGRTTTSAGYVCTYVCKGCSGRGCGVFVGCRRCPEVRVGVCARCA